MRGKHCTPVVGGGWISLAHHCHTYWVTPAKQLKILIPRANGTKKKKKKNLHTLYLHHHSFGSGNIYSSVAVAEDEDNLRVYNARRDKFRCAHTLLIQCRTGIMRSNKTRLTGDKYGIHTVTNQLK